MNIIVTAIIKSKSAYREEVKTFLKSMVQETLKEEACIQYDLHQDICDLNTFIFYEIWKDKTGLDIHNQQTYIKEFNQFIKEKVQEQPAIYLIQKV